MSKQKTPLQELIETLEGYFGRETFHAINFEAFKAKEREVIINDAEEGYHQESSSKIDGALYYNQTFEQ